MLTVYTPEQDEKWDRIVRSFSEFDTYWLSGYVKAFRIHGDGAERAAASAEVPAEYAAAVAAAVNLEGIILDLVGSWIWATGCTYIHKDALKAAGYRWASKKAAWYWRPESAACSRSSRKTLDEIREKYGSERLTGSGAVRYALN